MATQSTLMKTAARPREHSLSEPREHARLGSDFLANVFAALTHLEAKVFLSLLFAFALAVRLAALFGLRHISALPGMQQGADGVQFEQFARALAQGRGFVRPNGVPTSFRAPGFPMFVSVIYRITHISVSAATLSFAFVGAAACVATYLLAKEVAAERTARFAAVLSAVYFPIVYFCTVWLSEPLFMLCFTLSLWLFLVHLRKGSIAALVAAGLLFSWATLTRPFAILMLPVLLMAEWSYSRKRMLTVPLLALCALAPTSVWTARNYRVHHAFVLVSTNGGSTFYGGNNDTVLRVPQFMGAWVATTHLPGRAQIEAAPNEYLHDQVEWQLGKQWVRSHLAMMPVLIAMKLVRFVLPEIDSENKKFVLLSVVTYLPFLPLWILGFRELREKERLSPGWFLVHAAVATTLITAVVFWGSPRFRDAVAPLLMLYAACGVERVVSQHLSRSSAVVSRNIPQNVPAEIAKSA